ncbi:helix-turn-helix domain-containing protein [candidate division KSB1 bacterium]
MKTSKFLKAAQVSKKESKSLDFKREFNPSSASGWCEIIKDVIAMANSGGGIIVFGVKDDGSHSNFNKEIILNIDTADLADKIQSYTREDFSEVSILEIERGRKKVAAFMISPSLTPIAFTKNGADVTVGKKQKPAFVKGSVYFRHGSKSEPGNTNDIRRAIDKAVDQVRKNWIKGMRIVSNVGASEEIIVNTKKIKTSPSSIDSLTSLIKLSERGRPIKFTSSQVKELKKMFPLSYVQVSKRCKKKRKTKQKELQEYIDKCKKDQSLSLNWKLVSKSLDIPLVVPDKYTYSGKVVDKF